MNHEKLNRAVKSLEIIDVIQRASMSRLANDYFPRGDGDDEVAIQYKHNVIRSEVLAKEDQSSNDPYLFRVFIELGVRWCDGKDQVLDGQEEHPIGEKDGPEQLGIIEASYIAEYRLTDKDLEQDALDEFALNNASYHVWPYFREFVTTQCSRMSSPRITMPMVQFAINRNQKEGDDSVVAAEDD